MARESFRGAIPGDRLYDPGNNMWVRRDGDAIIIGATSYGLFLFGKVIAFTAKPRGAKVDMGRGLGTVESSKTVVAVHSPLSLLLENLNELAEENPSIINADPYGRGWMIQGRALDWAVESTALVDAITYAAHVRRLEPDATIES